MKEEHSRYKLEATMYKLQGKEVEVRRKGFSIALGILSVFTVLPVNHGEHTNLVVFGAMVLLVEFSTMAMIQVPFVLQSWICCLLFVQMERLCDHFVLLVPAEVPCSWRKDRYSCMILFACFFGSAIEHRALYSDTGLLLVYDAFQNHLQEET